MDILAGIMEKCHTGKNVDGLIMRFLCQEAILNDNHFEGNAIN